MIRQALAQAQKNIRENFATTLAGVVTTCFSLVILGTFSLFFLNLITITKEIFYVDHYSVFLKKKGNLVEKDQLLITLRKTKGVQGIVEVSPQKAWDDLIEGMGKQADVLKKLEFSNLPGVIEFKFKGDTRNAVKLVKSLTALSAVDEVIHGLETQGQISGFFQVSLFVGVVLILLLSTSILFIIQNSVKLALYDRIYEIGVLKILGATPRFIKLPYILEGFFISICGFFSAVLIVYLIYTFILAGVTFDESTFEIKKTAHFFTLEELGVSCLVVILLGAIGSISSTNKILKKLKS